jgi:hypothetical protein
MFISSPLSFEKERGWGELREGCGGCGERSEPQHCLVAIVRRINTLKEAPNVWKHCDNSEQ